jgi:MFS transporter, ACS family, hexuronate transporter
MKAGAEPVRTVLPVSAKWWICILLLFATVLNYLDRQVLSLTAEHVMSEFALDKEGFGRVLGAFRYSYALVQVFGGWIVDASGARGVFPMAVGVWSIAGVMTAFAPTLGTLMACRVVLGVGEAFNWPCALKVTEKLLEPKDRPLANGLFNSGTALGAMLAPLLVTGLVLQFGWRAPFVAAGALGGLWVIAWRRSTSSLPLSRERLEFRQVPAIMISILRKRAFWLLATSAVVVNGISYFLADWIPLYLKTERGFSFSTGNALSILVYTGLDAGNLLVGLYVRRAVRRGATVAGARNRALLAACGLMSTSALTGWTEVNAVALVCLVLTAIGVAAFLVIYLTLVQDLDPMHVGTAAGMLGGLGNLAYGLVSPYIGRMADANQSAVTFGVIAVLPWFAYFTISSAMRRRSNALLT